MRWILAAIALLGLLIALTTRSPGWMGVGILLALGGAIAAVFAFAQARIDATSRPEYLSDAEIAALKAALKPPAAPQPPGTP
ncbi:hypothetical protein [Mizugakiibacter sediminis]|nr:hypothetical protein [Mizugakiibacter sediminis]